MRGFPLDAIVHFRPGQWWLIVPILVGLVLVFLYFWGRQDTAKDFTRIATHGADAEKPVGALAAVHETLATSNKFALYAHAAIYGLLALISGVAASLFFVLDVVSLFSKGMTLVAAAWQIGLTLFFAVCAWLLARACHSDWREARAIDVARVVEQKSASVQK